MDKLNKIMMIWFVGFIIISITLVIAIILQHYRFNSNVVLAHSIILPFESKDNDSILSCDDQLCTFDLKLAMMDETLRVHNTTSLLMVQPHKIPNESNQSFP